MSSFAGYCDYCGKPVMHKTFLGTLHICLTEEERAVVDQREVMIANPLAKLIKKYPQLAEPYKENKDV